ncbi:MAG: aminoacyl-tRNA hydrolase [Pseudomonadota bacterium]
MWLLVGLGNPGQKYKNHRHNVGFMAIDAIAEAHRFGPGRQKFQGILREGTLSPPSGPTQKTLLLQPQTYMNDSGRSVREAMGFYKIPLNQVIAFHDELDLAPAKLRIKVGGGNAGHNGLRSIDSHCGNAFIRGRIGIGHPGHKDKVHNYVLGDFAKADGDWLTRLLGAIARRAPELVATSESSFARFQSLVASDVFPNQKEPASGAKAAAGSTDTKSRKSRGEQRDKLGGEAGGTATKSASVFADALKALVSPDKK